MSKRSPAKIRRDVSARFETERQIALDFVVQSVVLRNLAFDVFSLLMENGIGRQLPLTFTVSPPVVPYGSLEFTGGLVPDGGTVPAEVSAAIDRVEPLIVGLENRSSDFPEIVFGKVYMASETAHSLTLQVMENVATRELKGITNREAENLFRLLPRMGRERMMIRRAFAADTRPEMPRVELQRQLGYADTRFAKIVEACGLKSHRGGHGQLFTPIEVETVRRHVKQNGNGDFKTVAAAMLDADK